MSSGVSTIMPVWMREPRPAAIADLLRAAASVLSQECNLPFELLIIDDGSPTPLSGMPDLRSVLEDPRVRFVRLAQNQGLVYALNAGLTQARFDLVARIDGDDVWRPGKLRRQLELFSHDPDLTIAGTSMRLVHPHNPSLDRDDLRGASWTGVLEFFCAVGCPFPHGSILARRDVFQLLGGYPHSPVYMHCEDFALWGSWIRFFKAAILEDVLFDYTVSEDQVSSRHAEAQRRASGLVHQTFLDLGDARRLPAAVQEFADAWGVTLLETSRILCAAWMFYDYILADPELYTAARIVFPDRVVRLYEDAVDLLADRFFYLRRGAFDGAGTAHARIVDTPESVRRWEQTAEARR